MWRFVVNKLLLATKAFPKNCSHATAQAQSSHYNLGEEETEQKQGIRSYLYIRPMGCSPNWVLYTLCNLLIPLLWTEAFIYSYENSG